MLRKLGAKLTMPHHLLVGTWTRPGAIFSFSFDAGSRELQLIHRTAIDHDEPISWMTLNHTRKHLYGASMKTWTSYDIASPTSITRSASHQLTGHPKAASSDTNTRAIFVLAAQKPPYAVYGNPFYDFAGFGNVYSVSPTGTLEQNIQNYPYDENTGIHGMVFDPTETYLYSADLRANKLWTHQKDPDTGTLTLVDSQTAPEPGDHPRWVEMAPSGKYCYLLMEAGNWLAEYSIDTATAKPSYTGRRFPLLPENVRAENPKNYRGDVVVRSCTGRYLFATTRSNTVGVPGWISAYRLTEEGAIESQLCLQATSSSGGHSNAVSPCPWSEEWVALTDDTVGFIEMYRWENEKLSIAARCEVHEPGFGMNAVWLD
jgi:carboxy-cis,cis-muconate cyclase